MPFIRRTATHLLASFFLLANLAQALPSRKDMEWIPLDSLEAGFVFDIRYGTTNNFTHEILYPAPRVFLRRAPANALAAIQEELKAQGLGLKIFDGYRPLAVQQKMWNLIHDERYVSNPAVNKGRHTRGTAVDVSLVDNQGLELSMPTGYDDFTDKAHSDYQGPDLTPEQKKNRALLRTVMEKHGFTVLPTEWWHFDYKEWMEYPASNTPIANLPERP